MSPLLVLWLALGRILSPFLACGTAPHEADEPSLERWDRWRWVHFTAADGLPFERVSHLVEVGDVPWAGGRGWVVWYDGWRWRAPLSAEAFPDELLSGLTSDAAGVVYVAFSSGVFAGGTTGFEHLALPFLEPDYVITSVASPAPGELFILSISGEGETRTAELHRWRAGRIERLELDLGTVWYQGARLFESRSGRIWLNHDRGFEFWTDEGWKTFALAPERPVDLLAENASGQGLLGLRYPFDVRGLWTWEPAGLPHRVESEGHGVVLAADVGPGGEALVVYDTSAARFREAGRWRSIEPLPEALVQPTLVRFRANGDLWTANERGLWLLRRSSKRWSRFLHGGLNDPRDRIHALAFDAEGTLWLGTADGIERRAADGTPAPFVPLPEPTEVTGLAFDDEQGLWLSSGGTFNGLRHWDGASWSRLLEDAHGTALGLIHAIRPDRQGRLWLVGLTASLATPMEESGAVHLLEEGQAIPWEHAGELAHRRLYDFAEAQDGSLWFASSRGVSRWSDGRWRHWTEAEGLRGTFVFRVIPTDDGGAWVGQYQFGLSRIDAQGNVRQVELGGSTSRKCLGLALDDEGNLWISTGAGLYLWKNGNVSSFGYVAGLENLHAWPVIARGNKVFVGTLGGGLCVLDRAEATNPPPLVVLEELTQHDPALHARWSVHPYWGELPAGEIETRQRLDGGPWSDFSTARELVLQNTTPGEHTIEVQAKGLFGALGAASLEGFTSGRPLYLRRPFLIPLALLAPACLALATLYFVRRRRDAAALATREADYRTLMEGASDAIFWCDEDGICRGANSSACTLLGRERGEIIGFPLERFLTREDSTAAPFARLDQGKTAILALHALRADGQALPVEASVKRLDGERLLAIVRDLTERRALDQERQALERSLVQSQKLESLGLLAGGVAHDFNNLLMLVMGHADQALGRLREDGELRADLEQVLQAARRAGELTQKLLAFAGADSLEPQRTDLGQLVRELEDLLRSSIPPQVTLELDLATTLPSILGDPARLGQAILSLVINASEALAERSGAIVLATRLVPESERPSLLLELDALPARGDLVALSVSDGGSGMDEHTRARAFEPFFTTKPRARGLGLAAVAGILRGHRGGIALESRPGAGSTFTILFPAVAALDGEVATETTGGDAQRPNGGLVLVIDDDDAVREITAAMLQRAGFRTLTAPGGSAGIALFREHGHELLGTIVDLTMPGMSGLETRAALLAIRPDAAVLLTSGYNEQVLREREWLTPQAFLRKPFTTQELEARLRALAGAGSKA